MNQFGNQSLTRKQQLELLRDPDAFEQSNELFSKSIQSDNKYNTKLICTEKSTRISKFKSDRQHNKKSSCINVVSAAEPMPFGDTIVERDVIDLYADNAHTTTPQMNNYHNNDGTSSNNKNNNINKKNTTDTAVYSRGFPVATKINTTFTLPSLPTTTDQPQMKTQSLFSQYIDMQSINQNHCDNEIQMVQPSQFVLDDSNNLHKPAHDIVASIVERDIIPLPSPHPIDNIDMNQIEAENRYKLQSMNEHDIIQSRAEIQSLLSPELINAFQQRQNKQKTAQKLYSHQYSNVPLNVSQHDDNQPNINRLQHFTSDIDVVDNNQLYSADSDYSSVDSEFWLNIFRVDLCGTPIINSPSIELYHHNSNMAGYTLNDIIYLLYSNVAAQKLLNLQIIRYIFDNCYNSIYEQLYPNKQFTNHLIQHILQKQLCSILRNLLNHTNINLIHAVLHVYHSLLNASHPNHIHQSGADYSYILIDTIQTQYKLDSSMLEQINDIEVDESIVNICVVSGLISMKLLPRLRYLLTVDTVTIPHNSIQYRIYELCIDILCVMCRYSQHINNIVYNTPYLIDNIIDLLRHAIDNRQYILIYKSINLIILLAQGSIQHARQLIEPYNILDIVFTDKNIQYTNTIIPIMQLINIYSVYNILTYDQLQQASAVLQWNEWIVYDDGDMLSNQYIIKLTLLYQILIYCYSHDTQKSEHTPYYHSFISVSIINRLSTGNTYNTVVACIIDYMLLLNIPFNWSTVIDTYVTSADYYHLVELYISTTTTTTTILPVTLNNFPMCTQHDTTTDIEYRSHMLSAVLHVIQHTSQTEQYIDYIQSIVINLSCSVSVNRTSVTVLYEYIHQLHQIDYMFNTQLKYAVINTIALLLQYNMLYQANEFMKYHMFTDPSYQSIYDIYRILLITVNVEQYDMSKSIVLQHQPELPSLIHTNKTNIPHNICQLPPYRFMWLFQLMNKCKYLMNHTGEPATQRTNQLLQYIIELFDSYHEYIDHNILCVAITNTLIHIFMNENTMYLNQHVDNTIQQLMNVLFDCVQQHQLRLDLTNTLMVFDSIGILVPELIELYISDSYNNENYLNTLLFLCQLHLPVQWRISIYTQLIDILPTIIHCNNVHYINIELYYLLPIESNKDILNIYQRMLIVLDQYRNTTSILYNQFKHVTLHHITHTVFSMDNDMTLQQRVQRVIEYMPSHVSIDVVQDIAGYNMYNI